MGLMDALSTGARGLALASAGINVTTENVTGASQSGFSRRRLQSSQLAPVQHAGLWIGQGATALGFARQTDRLLGVRLIDSTGSEAMASTLSESLNVVEAWFGTGETTGISESLAGFFDALGSASSDPSDASLRRAVVAAAGTFATTVSRVATGLTESVGSFDEQVSASLEDVNALLSEIASLNAAIGRSGATSGPADLLDRRDQLVTELAATTGATVNLAADGSATVFIGGHAVVSGADARRLSAGEDADGNTTILVSMDDGAIELTDSVGGKIGGYLEARSLAQGWLDDLDNFAYALGSALNAQHAAGFDQNGGTGGDIFSVGSSSSGCAAALTVNGALAEDPTLLAFAGDSSAAAGDATNLESLLAIEDDTATFGKTAMAQVASIVADVGSATSTAESEAEAEAAMVSDLTTLRDSVSGVDTDEEAVNLLQYQAAYRAAARVVSAADELLQQLLAL
jgi:flagellar hook-associated protein 1 FlgK